MRVQFRFSPRSSGTVQEKSKNCPSTRREMRQQKNTLSYGFSIRGPYFLRILKNTVMRVLNKTVLKMIVNER